MTKIKTFEDLFEAVKKLYPDIYYYKENEFRFLKDFYTSGIYRIIYIRNRYRFSKEMGKNKYYNIFPFPETSKKDPQKIFDVIKAIKDCE